MSLITQKPDYSIADGNMNFDAVQINESNALIAVNYSDIAASDVTLELEQAISPSATFSSVQNSTVTVDPTKTMHSWNISGLAKGLFLRVVAKKGSAVVGTIDSINYLF